MSACLYSSLDRSFCTFCRFDQMARTTKWPSLTCGSGFSRYISWRGGFPSISSMYHSFLFCSTCYGPGVAVWDSSIVIAKYCERWRDRWQGRRCLDLSAGCGLVGGLAFLIMLLLIPFLVYAHLCSATTWSCPSLLTAHSYLLHEMQRSQPAALLSVGKS